jgi:hypothetical protein
MVVGKMPAAIRNITIINTKIEPKDCISKLLFCLAFLGRERLFPLFGPFAIDYLYIHTVDEV